MSGSKLTEGAATGGAAGLSVLGSAIGFCCLGPWSVALFGVSGAVFLSRLEPFRLPILVVAALLLAWALWRVYRPRKACADGTCAAMPSPYLKAALWISAALLLLAFFARDLQSLLLGILTPGGTQ